MVSICKVSSVKGICPLSISRVTYHKFYQEVVILTIMLTLSRLAIKLASASAAVWAVGLFEAAIPSVYSAAASRVTSDSVLMMSARTAMPPNFGKSAQEL